MGLIALPGEHLPKSALRWGAYRKADWQLISLTVLGVQAGIEAKGHEQEGLPSSRVYHYHYDFLLAVCVGRIRSCVQGSNINT